MIKNRILIVRSVSDHSPFAKVLSKHETTVGEFLDDNMFDDSVADKVQCLFNGAPVAFIDLGAGGIAKLQLGAGVVA
jgi:hypothetical protein